VQPRDTWRDIRNEFQRPPPETHYLLGVHSGLVELEIEEGDEASPVTIGLGKAWYPDAIDRAIEQYFRHTAVSAILPTVLAHGRSSIPTLKRESLCSLTNHPSRLIREF